MKIFWLILLVGNLLFACLESRNPESQAVNDSLPELNQLSIQYNDSTFVNLKDLDDRFYFDLRYAQANNFLKEKVYPCANCLLRYTVAKALIRVNDSLRNRGYALKVFDCYRPVTVQLKMWEILPDGRYVANPHKNGSVHNRGAAVDLTLVSLEGKSLPMGTDFDHFGKEAHHDFTDLPSEVIQNRKILKEAMKQAGFQPIRTEWWHYVYGEKEDFQLSDVALCSSDY